MEGEGEKGDNRMYICLRLSGTDPTLYTGDINYVDVVYKDAAHTFGWLVSIDGLTIEDSSIDVTNQIALVDTGTTLVYGPSSKLSDMYSKINGTFPLSGNWEGFWSVPCDTDPDVSFTFGGQKYPVKREDFLIVAFSNGTCVGTFVGSG